MSQTNRYQTGTGGRPWTPEEDVQAIDGVIHAQSNAELNRLCDGIAKYLGRGNRPGNGSLVWRRVYGLAIRLAEFATPPGIERPQRSGPPSHVERTLILDAIKSVSEEARSNRPAKPDAEYLATLLSRPVAWVAAQMVGLDPRRATNPLLGPEWQR